MKILPGRNLNQGKYIKNFNDAGTKREVRAGQRPQEIWKRDIVR
jgi:hypothetical protein